MVLFVLALISRLQGRELGIDEYRPSLQLRMCEQMTAILDEDEYNNSPVRNKSFLWFGRPDLLLYSQILFLRRK